MIVLVSYDLKNPDRDYQSLYTAIKNCSITWWHYLESVWLIRTELSPKDVFEKIHCSMDNNDSLLITVFNEEMYSGWLPSKAWEWIQNNK